MATLKDTLVLGKLTVVDKIVKSGGLPTSILTGDGSLASVGSRADSTATTGNSGQIYLVQRNAAGQLVVDVPWSAGSGDVVATSVAAGGGIDVTAGTSSYTVSHKDTSTATSVDGAIVNKITIDGYGHVTALGTTTIDLGSYVQGSSMTKDEIVIASNGTSIKTTGYYIQTSFDGGANKIPTSGAIQTWVEGKGYTTNAGTVTGSGLTDDQIIIGTGGVGIEASGKTISTSVGTDDNTIPTSKAIKTYVTGLGYTSNTGDITGVTAGNGLTGGATSGNATLNVGAGTGISVTADAVALATVSGLTAGSYGPSSNKSLNHLDSFSVPYVTVDTYGRVTAISTKTFTLPSGGSGGSGYDDTVHDFNEATGVMTIYSGDAATTGVTPGGYGEPAPATCSSGDYIAVPYFVVNEGGRIISARNTYMYLDDFATKNWVTENFQAKCLLEGTMITMADGSRKPVETVYPGDIVKSIDIDTKKETQAVVLMNGVRDIQNYYCRLMFEDGSSLKINWTHDVYNVTKDNWVKSDCELFLDDEVLKEDGTQVKFVGSIDPIGITGRRGHFYDLVVSNNCYYADGILCAHNPVTQYRWLVPSLNPQYSKIPQSLKNLIESYKDEDDRETDLNENQEFMDKFLPLMAQKMKKESRLRVLRSELAASDYVALKHSEGIQPTSETKEKIAARQWWRELYNEHEKELNDIDVQINKLKTTYSALGQEILLSPFDIRRKFFKESCKVANEHLQEFLDFYRRK